MSQLVFQPAFDPLHAAFRFLRIRNAIPDTASVPIDQARIMDFYLLFPFRIRSMRLAANDVGYRKLSDSYSNLMPYGEQPDAPLLFSRMQPMQTAALDALAEKGFIDSTALNDGLFKTTKLLTPGDLIQRIQELNEQQSDLMQFIRLLAINYDLTGKNGLKARTGLLEYQYDAI